MNMYEIGDEVRIAATGEFGIVRDIYIGITEEPIKYNVDVNGIEYLVEESELN